MINTKELRIGNWVYDGENTRFPMQVETIMKDSVYLDFEGNESDVIECRDKDIVPIPFTANLIKELIGGEIDEVLSHIGDVEFDISKNDDGIILTPSIDCQYCDIGSLIKYVHQLQNLVYALSEEELEIKKEWL